VAAYFLKRGYAVASIDYRTLQSNYWPTPVTDVEQGIKAVFRLFSNKINDVTYVGYSAGAVTGALLLYSNQFDTIQGIQRFIGISGLYDKEATPKEPIKVIQHHSLGKINLLESVESIQDAKTQTPALLIEGSEDYFADRFPYTDRSHANRLQQFLHAYHTPASVLWANQPNYNDHEGPIHLFATDDAKLNAAIKDFLN
jgi:acetyl esterase/lipase